MTAYTAAAMYGAAAFDGVISDLIPGDPNSPIAAVLAASALAILILAAGPRLPRWALAPLGPIGVAVVAYSLVGNASATDGAVLYLWPVLWAAFFFGRRGAVSIVICVGVAHGLALLSLPAASSYPGRWIDVMISVSVVAAVVRVLAHRNEELLTRLAGEARIDRLTGLLNRRGFEERASLELAHARRSGHSIAIAAFDIDHFKQINDEWGHQTGDLVLARVGAALATLSREVDVTARVGGEEFVVLLPAGDSADADAFTERIRLTLAAGGASGLPAVRVSAGVAVAVAPGSIEPLLRRADHALYAAKRAGRDRTVIFEPEEALFVPQPLTNV